MIYIQAAVLMFFSTVAINALADENKSCHELAGYVAETNELIYLDEIDAALAIPICKSEFETAPNDHNLSFFLARARNADGQYLEAFYDYKRAYDLGSAAAAAAISDFFYYGNVDFKYNAEKFFDWSKKAHELGSAYGTFNLAYAYEDGIGVISDWRKATDLYTEAHENGNKDASLRLAEIYAYGDLGSGKDLNKAKQIWSQKKSEGIENAWLDEAIFYLNNANNPQELVDAMMDLDRLEKLGWQHAKSELAFLNLMPANYKFSDTELVKPLLSISRGVSLGLEVMDTEYFLLNFDNAFLNSKNIHVLSSDQTGLISNQLQTIASGPKTKNAALASNILAGFHLEGLFQEKNIKKAIEYLKYSVDELGDHWAAVTLSDIYREEPGFRDLELALDYAKFAAKSPEPFFKANGLNTMGIALAYGGPSTQDLQQAVKYFQEAAAIIDKSEFILSSPFENLALIYSVGGKGLDKDVVAAKKYGEKIEENEGDTFAQYFLSRHNISNQTGDEEITDLLTQSFNEGYSKAAVALAGFYELRHNRAGMYQWAYVCSVLCADDEREYFAAWAAVLHGRLLSSELSQGQKMAANTIANYYQQNARVELAQEEPVNKRHKSIGKLHALLIGNAKYDTLENLETPIRDIRSIGSVIETRYGGLTTYVENGSRRDIISAFSKLEKVVSDKDSVMIFYAGHGKMVDAQNEGYWLPSDADPNDEFNWIPNSYIKSKVRALKARNVLLVADSCFSGLLTRGLEMPAEENILSRIQEFQETPSRVVISSGGLEPVLDGFGGKNSIFAYEFIRLLENKSNPLTSTELYTIIRDKVVEKSIKIGVKQVPFMATLVAEGHEGPDFVFIPN